MKRILILLVSIVTIQVNAQEEKKEENKKWTVGFGMNFIDNTSTYNDQFFNISDQWNFLPTISKISVERNINTLFSAEAALTGNRLSKNKLQNGTTIDSDLNYFALDVNGKFYFDEFIVKESKLDAYITLGAGINSADSVYNRTGNYGIGFNYWLQPNVGLRIQSIGKYAFEVQPICNNHLQHSAELIIKF